LLIMTKYPWMQKLLMEVQSDFDIESSIDFSEFGFGDSETHPAQRRLAIEHTMTHKKVEFHFVFVPTNRHLHHKKITLMKNINEITLRLGKWKEHYFIFVVPNSQFKPEGRTLIFGIESGSGEVNEQFKVFKEWIKERIKE